MKHVFVAVLAAGAMLAPGVSAAQNADCSRAKKPVEKIICSDPAAAAADRAMAAAWSALRDRLTGSDRDSLLRSQRLWIANRRAMDCEEGKPGYAACVIADANQRRLWLEGRPETGPGLDSPMQPVFVMRNGGKGAYEIDVELLRFASPKTAGERALDAAVEKAVRDIPSDKGLEREFRYSHDLWMRLTYASPRLISARFDGYDFEGGAHGSSPTWGLNIDTQSGRTLAFADAFDQPAREKLEQECLKQVLAQKKERIGETPAGDELTELKKNLSNDLGDLGIWSFSTSGADLVFNQYELGAYAEGRYSCAFPLALLKGLAKPTFPLPE